jgi:hypothetical protein
VTGEADALSLLAAWEERLRRVDDNLIALEAEPTYQMLTGPGRATLTGETKRVVEPALVALDDVFMHRGELDALVARARELWEGRGFWDKDERERELTALLAGRSIRVARPPSPVAQRNLLDAPTGDTLVLPDELLDQMSSSFRIARDAVTRVAAAWAEIEPRVTALEVDVAAARREAVDVGAVHTLEQELSGLEALLTDVRRLVASDPLGAGQSLGERVLPRVQELRRETALLSRHKATVTAGIARLGAVMTSIQEAWARAEAAVARAGSSVVIATSHVNTHGREISDLAQWRTKIETAAHAQHWKSADVGLSRWLESAEGTLKTLTTITRAVEEKETERVELEGLLSARRAQLQTLVARGQAVPPEVRTAEQSARDSLAARPTDLDDARSAVQHYATLVSELWRAGSR